MINNKKFTEAETVQTKAFFPPGAKQIDPWQNLNELLNFGIITCSIKTRLLQFRVKQFFALQNGWLECVVDEDVELGKEDEIRITVKQNVPITIYVGGKPPFVN